MKVLIADDNSIMRNMLKFYLSKYEDTIVNEVKGGIETLQFVKKNEIDILFLDLNMPNLDGYNVAKYLYDNKSNTNIVPISANINKDSISTFKSFGVKYFLSKPLQPKALNDIFTKLKKNINCSI
jgi:CheY-like chemotaxis protein